MKGEGENLTFKEINMDKEINVTAITVYVLIQNVYLNKHYKNSDLFMIFS